jgi:hypothetical protein
VADVDEQKPARVPPTQRALFGCLTLLVVLAAAELLGRVALGLVSGNWFAPRALQEERLQRIGGSATAEEAGYAPTPGWVQSAAIHPYVGFVEDPSISPWDITDFGFYETRRPLYERKENATIVGIFGGSFAYQFRENAVDELIARLQRDPRFAGREFIVTSTALGGYKQPQQLMALNWLLALGGEFDIVINIDGFNEVALYEAENRRHDVFPAYPRSWYYHAQGIGDGRFVDLAAAARKQEREIARAAAQHSRAPWRWFAVSDLLWVARDRRARARLDDAQQELQAYRGSAQRYVATGPEFDHSDDEAVYAALVDVWKQSSLQMARLCKANDIVYVHALQPNQYFEGGKPLSAEERRRFHRADHPYRVGVTRGYPGLLEAGRELTAEGVAFLDLTRLYADHPETIYVDDCCHVDVEGYRLVVEPLVEAVLAAAPQPGRDR